VSRWRSG